ncbi:hypothetical protein TNCV_880541 [Trichonephila clavipes]|nr:hypothetical protein TNCV_880541 [Trichonephila clavipes]
MANYSKCPLYPKPKKGTIIKTNYTNIVNIIVRPNLTFAQAIQNKQAPSTSTAPQQMAPRVGQVPAIKPTQTQAIKTTNPSLQQPKFNNNDCMSLISQTLVQTIQALSTLEEQINNISLAQNSPSFTINNKKKTKRQKLQELYALAEACIDDDDD